MRPSTRAPDAAVLLNPGPVNVHAAVRAALGYSDVCHREHEVLELLEAVRDKATRVCVRDRAHDFTSVVITGSGTAALEAAFASVVPSGKKVLILDNGHYGARLHAIVSVHEIPCVRLEFDWAAPMDLDAIDSALAADPEIAVVALVHHETSSGILNPLREVGTIVASHERQLAVDAISSLGSEPLDMRDDHISWCVGTANKSLEGLPGVSFVCASRAALQTLSDVPRRTYYLDLLSHYTAQEHKREPMFTPAVQVLYAFDAALDLMLAEGVAARNARYRRHALRIRAALVERGFSLAIPEEYRADELTLVRVPEDCTYQELHDALKREGFVIYAAPKQLGNVFRIANMGQLSDDDVDRFLAALDRTMARAGVGRPPGAGEE